MLARIREETLSGSDSQRDRIGSILFVSFSVLWIGLIDGRLHKVRVALSNEKEISHSRVSWQTRVCSLHQGPWLHRLVRPFCHSESDPIKVGTGTSSKSEINSTEWPSGSRK